MGAMDRQSPVECNAAGCKLGQVLLGLKQRCAQIQNGRQGFPCRKNPGSLRGKTPGNQIKAALRLAFLFNNGSLCHTSRIVVGGTAGSQGQRSAVATAGSFVAGALPDGIVGTVSNLAVVSCGLLAQALLPTQLCHINRIRMLVVAFIANCSSSTASQDEQSGVRSLTAVTAGRSSALLVAA